MLLELNDDVDDGNATVDAHYTKLEQLTFIITEPLSMIKSLVGFYPSKFDHLWFRLCPHIVSKPSHAVEQRKAQRRPLKLNPS